MVMKKINGWNDKEIFLLYEFLVSYEKGRLSSYQKDDELFKEHPEIKKVDTLFCSISYSTKDKSSKLKDLFPSSGKNEIYFLSHGTPLLSFLYHLRNSIAHGEIEKKGEEAFVVDWCKNRPTNFSAKGLISFETIKKITEILNKIEL